MVYVNDLILSGCDIFGVPMDSPMRHVEVVDYDL